MRHSILLSSVDAVELVVCHVLEVFCSGLQLVAIYFNAFAVIAGCLSGGLITSVHVICVSLMLLYSILVMFYAH